MKTLTRFTLSFAILVVCAFAQMPSPPQFSADISVSNPDSQPMKGKMFFGAGKVRMDMNSQRGEMSTITDSATQKSIVLMHEMKMYMETNLAGGPGGRRRGPKMPDIKALSENPCASEKDMTCKKVGTETVNGRSCDKWEFTNTTDPKQNRTAWVDQKTHLPMKSVGADGTTFEFTNFKEGPQDAKNFEVPKDYQKFDMSAMRQGRDNQ
ncbi:MAG: hypothetical protein JWO13_551 [Acidobacteriales bacterium]|nr:hypothetical protein [Terriglobales bacterium]